jgi:hypothetical protein
VVSQSLPIDPLLPDITSALRSGTRLVLRAPPGAGKTTRVPAALLDAGLAGDKQVLVLEPRRIAARAAAEYVAAERGGRAGGEVGYRVRFEQRGGAATRLWFLTEGVLGRQLGRDPFLEQAAIVVLDEFHERHLQGDIALAVVRELQETVRPDLKLLVMSATLETAALAAYLGDCPVLTSEGRSYPVQIELAAAPDDRPLAGRVAAALRRVLAAPADRHDHLVATISHLPYTRAVALMLTAHEAAAADPAVWEIAASGFRDTSRLAASDVTMILDILLTNQAAVSQMIAQAQAHLAHLAQALADGDESALRNLLEQAAQQRQRLYQQSNRVAK